MYTLGRSFSQPFGGTLGLLRRGGAAAAFDPLSLGDQLLAWWDFSDASTLYTDAGVTLVANDGDLIQQVNDKSGNGRHLPAESAPRRPAYRLNVQNGLSAGQFEGTVDRMRLASLTLGAFTIAAVLRNSHNDAQFFAHGSWGTAGHICDQLTTAEVVVAHGYNSVRDRKYYITNLADDAPHVVVMTWDGTFDSLHLYVDGAEPPYIADVQQDGGTGDVAAAWTFGSITGYAYEIVIANAALSANDLDSLSAYLAAKWGVALSAESSAQFIANAETYQTTPTYDGSGQAVHPDVVYFPGGWNGYTYWMAMTPYTNTNDKVENPSILASNDGATWVVPDGVTNPLAPTPLTDHNCDTDLLYNVATDELWIYYMEERRAAHSGGHEAEDWYNHNFLRVLKSADGVTWSGPTTVIDWDLDTDPLYVSPSVVLKDGTYYLWLVDSGTAAVYLSTSADGTTWGTFSSVTLGQPVWHLDVNYIPEKSQYWMVLNYPVTTGRIWFAWSADGTTWSVSDLPIMLPSNDGWDRGLYRATFRYDAANDLLKIWYSAYAGNVWHIGYVDTDYSDLADYLGIT